MAVNEAFSPGPMPDPNRPPKTFPCRVLKDGKDIEHVSHEDVNTGNCAVPNGAPIVIRLDKVENEVFKVLLSTAKALQDGHIKIPTRPSVTRVQIRVAGGWVRDKILGLQTHDIDIALDTCTGVEFATLVHDYVGYLQQAMEETSSNKNVAASVGKIGVIAANPSQSKHLETATMRVCGIDIDFSNLRHETYHGDSRIPTTTIIGTPLQDAYRRDFTMNSLYFNLQTEEVEDYTHIGLTHLVGDKPEVVTPLEPFQTFHDDPLRVLRAIRFAVRYRMSMDIQLQNACCHPQIHAELQRKVSRERVGKELEGMLSGKGANPKLALETITNLKLAGSVFCIPTTPSSFSDNQNESGKENSVVIDGLIGLKEPHSYQGSDEEQRQLREHAWEESKDCLLLLPKLLEQIDKKVTSSTETIASRVDSRMLFLATFVLPFFKLTYEEPTKVKPGCQQSKKPPKLVVEYMLREGIKFKNKDVQAMVTLMQNVENMAVLMHHGPLPGSPSTHGVLEEEQKDLRLRSGLILRATKDLWVTALVLACVLIIRRSEGLQGKDTGDNQFLKVDWYRRLKQWHQMILVEPFYLDHCWKVKPLLDGKAIITNLSLPKGPTIGFYSQKQVEWMLMNPSGTKEECTEYLKGVKKRQQQEEDEKTAFVTGQHISKKMHLSTP